MSASFSPLVRLLLWDIGRGMLHYNLVVFVILLFLFLVPGAWLGDPMVPR